MAKDSKTSSGGAASKAKTTAKDQPARTKAATGKGGGEKKAGGSGSGGAGAKGGLAQPVHPSKELAKIVGTSPLPRSEIVKKVWDYIKAHDLQNPKNKREIMADDTLEPIFGKKTVTMFEMNSHIARNVK